MLCNFIYFFSILTGVKGITENGFMLPTKGGMYGAGIYLATDSSKSAQTIYTKVWILYQSIFYFRATFFENFFAIFCHFSHCFIFFSSLLLVKVVKTGCHIYHFNFGGVKVVKISTYQHFLYKPYFPLFSKKSGKSGKYINLPTLFKQTIFSTFFEKSGKSGKNNSFIRNRKLYALII